MKRSRTRSRLLAGTAITLVMLAGAGTLAYRHLYPDLDAAVAATIDIFDAQGRRVGHYTAPSADEIAGLDNAGSVMLGRRILNETARLLPDNVGNDLNCNSCHMAGASGLSAITTSIPAAAPIRATCRARAR